MKKINFKGMFDSIIKQGKKHSTGIMTGIAVTGVGTTAYLTAKATIKAVRKVDEAELHKKEPLTKKEIVKEVWTEYIPPVTTAIVTGACIIGAQHQNQKRNAALATMYNATQVAFSEYKDEVVNQIGEKKERMVQQKINEKEIKKNPAPSDDKVVIIGDGDQLFYDYFSGRYFKSNVIEIGKAVNALNSRILSENYASVNDFWEELELEPLENGLLNGWSIDDILGGRTIDIKWDTQMTPDGRSAIIVQFDKDPHLNYDMFA